jgi:hypothetical protein
MTTTRTAYAKASDIGPGYVFTNPRTNTTLGTTHEPLKLNGTTVDLTTATSVLFLLKLTTSPFTAYSLTGAVDGTATNGDVKYVVASGFPTAEGRYAQEWEVTFSDGAKLTFPNGDYNFLVILPDLN